LENYSQPFSFFNSHPSQKNNQVLLVIKNGNPKK